jgi:hypothetical protein
MRNVDVLFICVGAVGFAAVILALRRYLKTALAVIHREDKALVRSAMPSRRRRS